MSGTGCPVPHNLLPCLTRLAQLQHESIDRLSMQEAAEAASCGQTNDPHGQLKIVARHLLVRVPHWLDAPDAAIMPALIYAHGIAQWGILRGKNAMNQ